MTEPIIRALRAQLRDGLSGFAHMAAESLATRRMLGGAAIQSLTERENPTSAGVADCEPAAGAAGHAAEERGPERDAAAVEARKTRRGSRGGRKNRT